MLSNLLNNLFLSIKQRVNNTKTGKDTSHIDVMDGLRGLAIFLVVFFHLWQFSWIDINKILPNPIDLYFIPREGHIGLEIFFFISGFCLFYPYARYLFENKPIPGVKEFFAKRLLKIIPSYFLSIYLILSLFPWEFESNRLFANVVSHLLFIHIWFDDSFSAINGVYWSLGVEVQFYLIFPLLCQAFRKYPISTFVGLVATSVIYRCWVYSLGITDQGIYTMRLSQLLGFLDLFAGGMMAAYVTVWARNRYQNLQQLAPLWTLIATVSLISLFGMMKNMDSVAFEFHGIPDWRVRNGHYLSFVLLVLSVSSAFSLPIFRAIVANGVLRFLSVISYNLYIWHQFIGIKLMKYKIPAAATLDPHDDPQWGIPYIILATVLCLTVATILTYSFEQPILKWGAKRIREATFFKQKA